MGGDLLGIERVVTADVDEEGRLRLVFVGLRLEVGEGHAQVFAVAVDKCDARTGADRRERGGHERVRGAQDGVAGYFGEVERRERSAGPARDGDRFETVVR